MLQLEVQGYSQCQMSTRDSAFSDTRRISWQCSGNAAGSKTSPAGSPKLSRKIAGSRSSPSSSSHLSNKTPAASSTSSGSSKRSRPQQLSANQANKTDRKTSLRPIRRRQHSSTYFKHWRWSQWLLRRMVNVNVRWQMYRYPLGIPKRAAPLDSVPLAHSLSTLHPQQKNSKTRSVG
jgi:hypothetical protein